MKVRMNHLLLLNARADHSILVMISFVAKANERTVILVANLMATVNELNDAIEILKAECYAHKECESCDFHEIDGCKLLENIPMDWETIKDGDSDG